MNEVTLEYGQGAAELMEILGLDPSEVVGDLMNKLKSDAEVSERNIRNLSQTIEAQYIKIEKLIADHKAHLEEIDELVQDCTMKVPCRSCGEYYALDYEVSLYKADTSYCGRSDSCCP